ncbi:hypothetical protein R3P38DRAFT_3173738 [Favolaschia claudopus]|uniref:Uncharacterized protein n=1 Tax=Favolaschia claudopus TaxID=2862362 RepID=A0AAW0DCH9_9AGAR
MALPPFRWRSYDSRRSHLTFCDSVDFRVTEAKAEQAQTHRLWPLRDRSNVSNYADAVTQRYFWRGRLAASAAVASIRSAAANQAHFEEWIHRHALAVQPPGTQLDWGSGAGWGSSRGNVAVRGWGQADSDGGWGTTSDWNSTPFKSDLTTHIWSTTSFSNPGSSSLAWGSPRGSWGTAFIPRIPKIPGKAKRRRLRKRRIREMEEKYEAARQRRDDERRRMDSANWILQECS